MKNGRNYFRPNTFGDKIMITKANIPSRFSYHLLYVVLIPVFFLTFCLIYNPFDIIGFYDDVLGNNYAFHLVMLSCIMLGTITITRLVLSAMLRHNAFVWWQYSVWCLGEILVVSMFEALYSTLFFGDELPYFMAVSYCLQFVGTVVIYPYIILILIRVIAERNEALAQKDSFSDLSLAKFYDYSQRLKLTVAPSALLYVSAELNYIKIHYLENGVETEYLLRNSMKSLDNVAARYGLVRCHRSYYVNPTKVTVLGRNKDGAFCAELNGSSATVPVSKLYYEQLIEIL